MDGGEVVEGSHQQGLNLVMMQFRFDAMQCDALNSDTIQGAGKIV